MEQQIHATAFKHRYPQSSFSATIIAGKDPAMNPAVEPDETLQNDVAIHALSRPHASEWLWHPWYAKLWWAAIAAYWAGMVGSLYSPALDQFYTSALAGFLNLAFFPPLALMVLGLGFGRAWFAWSDWEFVEPTHDQMFPKRSVGGMRDPCADPLDPRSGPLHWRYLEGGK